MSYPGIGGIPISNRMEADGTIQVTVTSAMLGNVQAAMMGGPANFSGVIYVSPAEAMIINATHGTSGSMFTGMMTNPFSTACVSAIALSMSYVSGPYGFVFDGGRVFLYLNGTMHGSFLQF